MNLPLMRDVVERSFILAYREDVRPLEDSLVRSGLRPTVMRQSYSDEERELPAATRTFMAHRNAWRAAAEAEGYTLICEADFVPCESLGSFPVFWPTDNPRAWGYLYQGSPRLLSLVGEARWMRGHCAPLVAYVVGPEAARIMLRYYEAESREYDLREYVTFDAHLQWWVMGQGAEAYIPARHYGEHGGFPNKEHALMGKLPRAGRHRADNLRGPLAFLPQYAQGSRVRYWMERAHARALGFARLATGRWIVDTNVYTRDISQTIEMQWVGLRRLL